MKVFKTCVLPWNDMCDSHNEAKFYRHLVNHIIGHLKVNDPELSQVIENTITASDPIYRGQPR